jgi:hypothetical protein
VRVLVYLPSYSPDLNPIEEALAKIKHLLREASARTREALVEAMGAALSAISARDALGFFEHAGYRLAGHYRETRCEHGFFEGVCAPARRPHIPATHPHRLDSAS